MVDQQFADPFEGFASPVFFRGKDGEIYARITLKHATANGTEWGVFLGYLVLGPLIAFFLAVGGGGVGGIIGYCLGVWWGLSIAQKTTILIIGANNIKINNKNYDISNPVTFRSHVHPKSSEAKGTAKVGPNGQIIKSKYDEAYLSCVEINGQPIVMVELLDRGKADLLCGRVRGIVNSIKRGLIKVK